MSRFTVTITDKVFWTTTVDAVDSIDAENKAWVLFQSPDRSEYFDEASDTTVRVDDIEPAHHINPNESTTHA